MSHHPYKEEAPKVPKNLDKMINRCKCEITKEFMKDPVITHESHHYEKKEIKKYIKKHKKDPKTGTELSKSDLKPDKVAQKHLKDLRSLKNSLP